MKRFLLCITITLYSIFTAAQTAGGEIKFDAKAEKTPRNSSPKRRNLSSPSKSNSIRKRRLSTSKIQPSPHAATYLFVNQNITLGNVVGSEKHLETYSVKTDGANWNIRYLPPWCKIESKTNESITLSYDANTTHFERSDWFEVYSDTQTVRVSVTQNGIPIDITGGVRNINVQHNCGEGVIKDLVVDVDVSLKGAKGLKCLCCMNVVDEYGHSIRTWNKMYSRNGAVYTEGNLVPTIDEEMKYKVQNVIPNNTFVLPKKRCKLYLIITLMYDGKCIAEDGVEIEAKRGRDGIVKTKDVRSRYKNGTHNNI